MSKLYFSLENKFLGQLDKPEKDLNRFICENWSSLFPQYKFIKSEFVLKGTTRASGKSGRIDILSYNPNTKRFVVFELKRDFDKNIKDQASDYRDYIEDNFSEIYLQATQKYKIELPPYYEMEQDKVELILVSKRFDSIQIERVKKLNSKGGCVTLIKYNWFENDIVVIDYINNDPDEIRQEQSNKHGDKKSTDPNIQEIELYFGLYPESKDIFMSFFEYIKSKGEVKVLSQQSKLKVTLNDIVTFSAIHKGGKDQLKIYLQINTDYDVTGLEDYYFGGRIEDRIRKDGTKKGSLGVERYEVYFRNTEDIQSFCKYIDNLI